jgi:hypothetical protein
MELLPLVSGAISSTCTACPWKAELTEARCQANYWKAQHQRAREREAKLEHGSLDATFEEQVVP